MLGFIGGDDVFSFIVSVYLSVKNMIDIVFVFIGLCGYDDFFVVKKKVFDDFLNKWKDDNNVSCIWFRMVVFDVGKGGVNVIDEMK